jgi:nucleotide-binding universal stress UspA family protein
VIEKILVPLDGSKLAEKTLPYASTLAQKFEAEIILVRVIQPMPIMSIYDDAAFYEFDYRWGPSYKPLIHGQSDANLSNLYLTGVRSKLHKRNLSVRTAIVEGYPEAETIVNLARQEAVDLIVMSTHGRSGIRRWVHGSVAEQVLRVAPCPIFLVRAVETEC